MLEVSPGFPELAYCIFVFFMGKRSGLPKEIISRRRVVSRRSIQIVEQLLTPGAGRQPVSRAGKKRMRSHPIRHYRAVREELVLDIKQSREHGLQAEHEGGATRLMSRYL